MAEITPDETGSDNVEATGPGTSALKRLAELAVGKAATLLKQGIRPLDCAFPVEPGPEGHPRIRVGWIVLAAEPTVRPGLAMLSDGGIYTYTNTGSHDVYGAQGRLGSRLTADLDEQAAANILAEVGRTEPAADPRQVLAEYIGQLVDVLTGQTGSEG